VKARFAAVFALSALLAACGASGLKARAAKPEFVGDRLLMDRQVANALRHSGAWWTARYQTSSSDRALFSPCAPPKDSLYAFVVMFANSALYLDRDGAQRRFLVTSSAKEKLMWASQDGRVLCTYLDYAGGSPTVQARIGTWQGRKLLDFDSVPTGEFFLGDTGGFVHLTATPVSAAKPEGGPVRLALAFMDYGGKVLGIDSTAAPVVPRSWRASHSPEADAFAIAASWSTAHGADDSLICFRAPQGRRLWSRSLDGKPERLCVGRNGQRLVVSVALDDSTRRVSVFDGKGRTLVEKTMHGGPTEDIALSCNGRLAFIAGEGYRALARLDAGEFAYALADSSLRLRKASVSNTGQAFAVYGPTGNPDKPVEALLFNPAGAVFWRTTSDSSVPATDVWISPDGARLFLRVYNTLERYE
jgi:hypothetical protein